MLKAITYLYLFSFFLFVQDRNTVPLKLNWGQHFRGKADEESKYLALTSLVFRYAYQSAASQNQINLKFTFLADVNVEKSWHKKDKIPNKADQDRLLQHEQGHVDLNFLMMKEAEKRLKSNKYSVKNYKTEIKAIADKVIEEYDALQKKYDHETEHGVNRKSQESWEDFIQMTIESYSKSRN